MENTSINRILDRALTSSDGQYSFTVSKTDDDGTFIDPYIEVYAGDNERVTVSPYADASMTLTYFEKFSIGSEIQTDTVTDFNIQGNNGQAMYIFDTLANMGYNAVPWQSSAQVTVQWPNGCISIPTLDACYVYRTIYLTQDAGLRPDVILHEYGHFVLDNYVFALQITTACPVFRHSLWTTDDSSPTCAWSEGWATFYEMMAQYRVDKAKYPPNYNGYDLETPVSADLAKLTPKENSEMIVAVSLWDIYDDAVEPFDVVQDGLDGPANNGIWKVTTTNDPFTSAEFWQEWDKIRGKTCEVSAIFQNYGLQFDPFMYKLTTQVNGPGSIAAIPAPSCPQNTYLQQTDVTLNAQPSAGNVLINWSGDISGSANPYTLSMDADKSVTANFGQPSPTPPPTNTPTPTPTSTSTAVPTPTTITIQINQGNDDASNSPSACAFSPGNNEVYLGLCDNGQSIISGFRFANLTIPQGSTIQHAVIHFTEDGTYTNPLNLEIFAENSANAQTFSSGSQPANRALTGASASWQIASGQTWTLGTRTDSPDLKGMVQEVVNRADWVSGNALAIIIKNSSASGSISHRRVIALERASWDSTLSAASLEITYIPSSTPVPTSTSTPPTSTSTPTSTIVPTSKPPCACPILELFGGCTNTTVFAASEFDLEASPTQVSTPIPGQLNAFRSLQTALVDIQLFYRVRDEILTSTAQGQHYIDLYETHGPEISTMLRDDPDLRSEAISVLETWQPSLTMLVNGQGQAAVISDELVQQTQAFLDHIYSQAGPELQQAITSEQTATPLTGLVGMTMEQAWKHLQGYQLNWLPPLTKENSYHIQAKQTIPVKFEIKDANGAFVHDASVRLQLKDKNGAVVIGPVKPKEQASKMYHYNLQLPKLAPGMYTLEVYGDSLGTGEPMQITIIVEK